MAQVSLKDINILQQKIMEFVDYWVHEEKTPVPRDEIISEMAKMKEKPNTVVKSINSLIRKGYLKRGIKVSNKTSYIMLRRA